MSASTYNAVTVVVPVYGDWPSLSDCIQSLIEHVDFQQGHRVMLVNDCGPDVEKIEQNIMKAIKGEVGISYHRNSRNLGFVGTCNRAVFELDDSSRDILLLNSDTIVTEHFLEELMQVLSDAPKIGAVSPRSNNATIATIPMSAMREKGIDPKESYRLYKRVRPMLPQYTLSPVAHGFCMLIRRELINKFGLFDPAFGKGYGEETDFCMRIRKKGYLSALCNQSYVFHMEARSFTLETKQKLVKKNDKIMVERYPQYHALVREYVDNGSDIVDRFAHVIGAAKPSTLIDIRGLSKLAGVQRDDAVRIIRDFVSSTKASISYLADGGNAAPELPPGLSVYSESNINERFFLLFRPFNYTARHQLFTVNRYCLKFMLIGSPSTNPVVKLAESFNDAPASNVAVNQSNLSVIYRSLIKSPIEVDKLRERWSTLIASESRALRLSGVYKRLVGVAKPIVMRNKLVARSIRKAKKLLKR